MKISKYFEAKSKIRASEQEKIEIYQRFLQKSEKVSLFKKISFYSKIWVYSIFILFISISFYIPFLQNQTSDTKDLWDTLSANDYDDDSEFEEISNELKNNKIVKEHNAFNDEEAELSESDKNDIPSDKLSELRKITHSSFLRRDISNLVTNYLNWNDSAYNISYDNINNRINNVYKILDIEKYSYSLNLPSRDKDRSIYNLFMSMEQLVSRVNEKYNLPEEYSSRLNVILAWTIILKDSDFWKYKWENLDLEQVLDTLRIDSYRNTLTFTN